MAGQSEFIRAISKIMLVSTAQNNAGWLAGTRRVAQPSDRLLTPAVNDGVMSAKFWSRIRCPPRGRAGSKPEEAVNFER